MKKMNVMTRKSWLKPMLWTLCTLLSFSLRAVAQVPFAGGTLTVKPVARNAVRVVYAQGAVNDSLPQWLYVDPDNEEDLLDISVNIDARHQRLTIRDSEGHDVFTATSHQLTPATDAPLGCEGMKTATLAVASPADECLFGLGQFQDGYSNVRGLPRRLTQVNTQISLPMIISNKGYGLLWNNYGLTEFNPPAQQVALQLQSDTQGQGEEVVNVTSTEGGRQEVRRRNRFEATISVPADGDYAVLLDVGQKMARRHNLCIDGQTVIEMQNLWLPPTASAIVSLKAGRHLLTAELSQGDRPVVGWQRVTDKTVFRSPLAQSVDYTVFVGTADEIVSTYRQLTGPAPLMPSWALGYIHCRERFHSQAEILETARRFQRQQMPLDVIVQDWQYWGRYGWNSMQFDERYYPDPKALTDSLHQMGVRLMVSVWSKIDKNSEVGRQMVAGQHYIPGTDWIDFFSPAAASAYWQHFRQRLVPLGIDAWWQDATEPENDDLVGRRVNGGRWAGELVRNVYPLLVNKTVYEGLVDAGQQQPMILTRCGFPGIQRYGSALWSGDVGNDWETFRRQIVAGLGVQAAGVPWWTYDAGGFFRPADQYSNQEYIERMLRWVQTAVYLPLMRVHGYMSNTEPWNYGDDAQLVFTMSLRERQLLRPYIEECAQRIANEGYTLMRPLVFDFANDPVALGQKYEYMFGPSLLVSPITEPGVTHWQTYLPRNEGGWTEVHTARHYDGGQMVTTEVSPYYIPVFMRCGHEHPLLRELSHSLRQRIVEDGGTGPFKAVMKEEVSLPAHTIFVPQDLSSFGPQRQLPVLVWGNGACNNSPFEHYKFLNEIASHGFIVVATGYIPMDDTPYRGPMSTTQQQIESIDWVLAQNSNSASPYYGKIDTSHICLAGMSCGGLQTLFNCADPRITSLMICNSGLFNRQNASQAVGGMPMPPKEKLQDIHCPIIYMLGGEPDIAYGNGMDDFHRISHVPACAVNLPVGHGGTYAQPHGGEFAVVATAWLQWQLKGDRQAARMFCGEHPAITLREGWTLEKNEAFERVTR